MQGVRAERWFGVQTPLHQLEVTQCCDSSRSRLERRGQVVMQSLQSRQGGRKGGQRGGHRAMLSGRCLAVAWGDCPGNLRVLKFVRVDNLGELGREGWTCGVAIGIMDTCAFLVRQFDGLAVDISG
ncbi:unnamed protein product [Ostreobium quekettii]|uniref:Uncharacterized protein n=1 Tax=Ostreobium quekettii TaxID=121088 RepID=A0A8S1ITX2_9CHLO|nr:unnamed protein product [Ostreobium quekettii]